MKKLLVILFLLAAKQTKCNNLRVSEVISIVSAFKAGEILGSNGIFTPIRPNHILFPVALGYISNAMDDLARYKYRITYSKKNMLACGLGILCGLGQQFFKEYSRRAAQANEAAPAVGAAPGNALPAA